MGFLESASTGNYPVRGDIRQAEFILGQSFGAGPNGEPGRSNEAIAEDIERLIHDFELGDIPLVLQQEIADAAEHLGMTVRFRIEGAPSTAVGTQLDSWEVLSIGKRIGDVHEWEHPLLATQAFLMGRLTMQAVKMGMDPVVVSGFTKTFDPESTQMWTRNQTLWVAREVPGAAYLKLRGKL